MAYQRQVFTRKRVFIIPNTTYPPSSIRHQQIRRINQLDTTYRPFHSEQRIDLYSLNGVFVLPNNTAYSARCMTRSSPKELITPFENPKSAFRSRKEAIRRTWAISQGTLRNTFSGSEHEDANEHIEKVLKIVDLFHIPEVTQDQVLLRVFPMSLTGAASRWLRNEPSGLITNWETLKTKILNKYCPPARTAKKMEEINNFQQEPDKSLFRAWERFKERLMECPQHYLTDMQKVILFHNGLDVPTRQILNSKGAIPTKTATDAKIVIQEMAEYSLKWHNRTSSKAKSTETSDGLAAIQAQLNNLGREIKKVNKKVYAAHVGCELCKGPHYTKDCPLKEEGNTLKEAYYTQFGAPYQPAGQYRAVGPGFYQRNNGNSSYPDRRQTLEESLTKFMAESVLQERGIGGLPDSTEPNSRDHVKLISTTKADSSEICRMGYSPYAVSGSHHRSIFSKIVPFPRNNTAYPRDLAIRKSALWYTLKKTCVELVRSILNPHQHTFAQELKMEIHPSTYQGVPRI
ncbi:hypothetical protein Tco_1560875 [Tanacetum coccineum]